MIAWKLNVRSLQNNIPLAMCSMGNKEKQLQYIIMLYVTFMLFQRIEMS